MTTTLVPKTHCREVSASMPNFQMAAAAAQHSVSKSKLVKTESVLEAVKPTVMITIPAQKTPVMPFRAVKTKRMIRLSQMTKKLALSTNAVMV